MLFTVRFSSQESVFLRLLTLPYAFSKLTVCRMEMHDPLPSPGVIVLLHIIPSPETEQWPRKSPIPSNQI
jgi:hypothetical protein